MRCRRIGRMLSAYVDNELGEDKIAFVNNHLSCCPECRQALSDFKKEQELFSRKDSQTGGPLFWEELTSRLREKREELITFIWVRRLVFVTSALVLTVGVFLIKSFIEEPQPVTVGSVIAENGVSMEERIVNSGEKITDDTVLRLVAYHPSDW
ncbi:MAG: zf-HC2 domain-containing protein [Nitrospirae bacterium]|nr:zf-HC2 domain-containing protein [Nitrospirota bacterium]